MAQRKIKVAHLKESQPLIGKKILVENKEIGLFLTEGGNVYAVNNICPHKNGPLSEGIVSGEFVYCPLHDQKVDLTTGIVQEPDTGCVESYKVEIIDEDVYVCL